MTLHDKLKEILPDAPYSTISAIIAAFTELLPGETEDFDYYNMGWNAYRQEVLRIMTP